MDRALSSRGRFARQAGLSPHHARSPQSATGNNATQADHPACQPARREQGDVAVLLLYHFLVHLYPATYRGEYGEEMLAVLSEVLTENQKKGVMAQIVSAVCEIAGLLCGALEEHISNITGSVRVQKSFSRRVTMRSDFRFPKATVTLMALVLLAVFLAIEKGKDIQASIAYANPQVGPIHQ